MALYLIALVGVPGSGKSTVAARSTLPVVSSDGVRADLLGDAACQDRPDDVWAEVHRRLAVHLAAGHSVMLDATNVDPAHRAQLLRIAREAAATPVVWRVTTWHRTSRRANRRRDRVVPDDVMNHMIGLYNRHCTVAVLEAEGWTVRNITAEIRPGSAGARMIFGEPAR